MTDDTLQTMEKLIATGKRLKDRIAALEHFARVSDQKGEWVLIFRPGKTSGEVHTDMSRHAAQLASLVRNELGYTKAAFQELDMPEGG